MSDRLDDPGLVREQYATTDRLRTRMAVWGPAADGRTPQDAALAAVEEAAARRVLEVGCGTGAFAARLAGETGAEVIALDSSPEMVAATAARGVDARLGDVGNLPFADGSFDCAVAAWMLYHVLQLDRAVAELARVLRPGGRLVAVTNGRPHLAELWALVGDEPAATTFSSQNGAEVLNRSFPQIVREDIQTEAVFPDRETAAGYLDSLGRGHLAERLPQDGWPLRATGWTTVFRADLPDRPLP